MSSPDQTKKKKAAAPTQSSSAAPAPALELAQDDSRQDNLQNALEGLGQQAGDVLKSLASWRLVETKSEEAAPDPLWVSLKNLATWKFNEEPDPKPEPLPRLSSGDEDPLLERVHQVEDYVNSLELFKPGEAVAEYQHQADADLNRLGAVLKDAASWRGPTLRGLVSWRVVEGDAVEPRDQTDSIRNSLKGFADVGHQASDFLKGIGSGRTAEAASDESARNPDSILSSLKDIATWRINLKNLATWRLTNKPDAEPDAASLESSVEKPFADLAHQAGDYLKGLATWRMTESSSDKAAPEAGKEAAAPAGVEPEPYKFDVLTSALTRNEVKRP